MMRGLKFIGPDIDYTCTDRHHGHSDLKYVRVTVRESGAIKCSRPAPATHTATATQTTQKTQTKQSTQTTRTMPLAVPARARVTLAGWVTHAPSSTSSQPKSSQHHLRACVRVPRGWEHEHELGWAGRAEPSRRPLLHGRFRVF